MNKKLVYLVALLLLVAARVFPGFGFVNNLASGHANSTPLLVTDGDPKPPPIPHRSTLVADGDPRPAPIPHARQSMVALV